MLMPMLARILPRTLSAAAVLVAVAAPAGAKIVYRWKTDDGVYAFTDDAKRVPEKYRSQAKTSPLRSLPGYKNYTPAQRSGTASYAKRMESSAIAMSRLNARLSGQGVAPGGSYYGGPSGEEAVLRVGTSGNSNVEIQSSLADDSASPIMVEQKRFYVPGLNSTRTNTIVRQGNKILAVTKPIANEGDISDFPSESTLPE
jgi:hypothetical protein